MNPRMVVPIAAVLAFASTCLAQTKRSSSNGSVCDAPPPISSPALAYQADKVKDQPDQTADLPSVVKTVQKALECYQALSHEPDPLQPKGLPKLASAALDFKTTTSKTVGLTFSVFVFKIGGSREKDVTTDISFTYAPKSATFPKGFVKKEPAPLYAELIKAIGSAASAAQAQSTLLGLPLNKVSVMVSYGIKFDGNISINVPVQLVTIGGNGDYNKNNTQSITLTFGPQTPSPTHGTP